MSEVAESTQKTEVNPFEDNNTGKIELPANEVKEIKGEETKTDPAIEEKDEKIEKEKPVITKTNEPDKTPKASPKDIPARTEKEKEETKPSQELKFANETSEKIFNLLKEGKEDDVFNYLNQKQVLKSIDKLPPAEVIKLQLKNENKDFTPSEVEDLFQEIYSAPEKPIQKEEETDAEFKIREEKYENKLSKLERKIEREAKTSKAELLKLQQDLVLPDIPKKEEPKLQEPSQEELAETQKARESYLNSIDEGLNNFTSINATFKDKDVEIPVAYKISAEERKELKETMENFNLENFIQERWLTKDGKFNTEQQAKDIFLLTQGEKAIEKLVNEAGNKRYKEAIKNTKNVDFSGNSKSGNFNPSVADQLEKAAQHFYSN